MTAGVRCATSAPGACRGRCRSHRGSAAPLAFEIYLEHYKGSFGDKWEWVPIWLTPPVVAAGIGGVYSERVGDAPRCRSQAACSPRAA